MSNKVTIDRELLELAAKAAGMKITPHVNARLFMNLMFVANGGNWNPLTDDGDALRLAVKLRLLVNVNKKTACAMPPDQTSDDYFEAIEQVKGDPYAAARRAIVRAAAEIGKDKP